ncbi:MAG: tryptophan synthase subunit beta [Planctomycetes bacterium]|nr:tryptophan synthase subunit beta [Planctomycetota bacterium]
MTVPRVGAFGAFGGRYASELLRPALMELSDALDSIVPSAAFQAELAAELAAWAGRPTPITMLPSFSEDAGVEVWVKREDLLHGGAHKTNNVVGQGLLAKRLGKSRLIAETGAGQHGLATAMVGARLGMETVVYMGAVDVERQMPNVRAMELLGATVVPVTGGAATLKEAINEALRDWTGSVGDTHYLLGTVCGPDPFPRLVRRFHEVIGIEARAQFHADAGGLPDACVACVGGGSNAIGLFSAFIEDSDVVLLGAEPAGHGTEDPGAHGRTLGLGSPGLLHGARTYVLQDDDGQILEAHSVAAGLDYPGVGPEHAHLQDSGRARYIGVTDSEALDAFERLSRSEGIVPAFESAHAMALVLRAVDEELLQANARVLVNLSGRGQKDLDTYFGLRPKEGVS